MYPTDSTEVQSLQVAFLTAPDSDPSYQAYREINGSVTAAFEECGVRVRYVEAIQEVDPASDDILLCMGTPPYRKEFLPGLQQLRVRGKRPFVCLWHIENLFDGSMPLPKRAALQVRDWLTYRKTGAYPFTRSGSYLLLKHLCQQKLIDKLFMFTRHKTNFLLQSGIPAEYLPLGYHPLWGTDRGTERDIDVLYVGMLHGRREELVNAVREQLKASGVALRTNYEFADVGSVWGEQRDALLNRAKIFFCVYRYPLDFSGMRFSLGMGNGAVVVSEPVADPYPFVPGTHFVESPIEDLAETILRLLKDEPEQERVRKAAKELLEREYTLKQSVEHILQTARNHSDKTV